MQADNGGERWSLGDLLARASRDDDGIARAPVLDLQGIAGALDPTTASAIWSRFRAGQRGIMVRSIYTAEGRTSFDQVSERYGRDADFRRTVDRFLADFERLVRDVEQQSPRSRARPPGLRRRPRLSLPGPRQRPLALSRHPRPGLSSPCAEGGPSACTRGEEDAPRVGAVSLLDRRHDSIAKVPTRLARQVGVSVERGRSPPPDASSDLDRPLRCGARSAMADLNRGRIASPLFMTKALPSS